MGLLQIKRHLPETLYIESPDVSDEKLAKEFWHSKKSASYNQTKSFLLAKKHIFHISIKLNAFNIKLRSVVPEVIQRLSAKFGANWPIGGNITDVSAFLPFKQVIFKKNKKKLNVTVLRPIC